MNFGGGEVARLGCSPRRASDVRPQVENVSLSDRVEWAGFVNSRGRAFLLRGAARAGIALRTTNCQHQDRLERRKGMFGHQSGFRDRASVYPAFEELVTWEMSGREDLPKPLRCSNAA